MACHSILTVGSIIRSSFRAMDRPDIEVHVKRLNRIIAVAGTAAILTASAAMADQSSIAKGHGAAVKAIAQAADYASGKAHGAAVSAFAKTHGKTVSAAARAHGAAASTAGKAKGAAAGEPGGLKNHDD